MTIQEALDILQEPERYQQGDIEKASDIVIAAASLQIVRPVEFAVNENGKKMSYCPNCHNLIQYGKQRHDSAMGHCTFCGQMLRWYKDDDKASKEVAPSLYQYGLLANAIIAQAMNEYADLYALDIRNPGMYTQDLQSLERFFLSSKQYAALMSYDGQWIIDQCRDKAYKTITLYEIKGHDKYGVIDRKTGICLQIFNNKLKAVRWCADKQGIPVKDFIFWYKKDVGRLDVRIDTERDTEYDQMGMLLERLQNADDGNG